MKRRDINQKIAERVRQLPSAEVRKLAGSAAARRNFAAETEKLSNQQRKELK
jgi:hypothetical protein